MKIIIEYETEIPIQAVPLILDIEIRMKRYPPFIQYFESPFFSAGGGRKGYLIFSFDTLDPEKSFKIERADFGTTHLYGPLSTRRCAGMHWWAHEILPMKTPVFSKALERTEQNLNAKIISTSRNKVDVKFEIHGQLPFMPYKSYTPDYWAKSAIDGELTLQIETSEGPSKFRIHGAHDGFPKHTIRINGKEIYTHDPLKTGDSPISLMGDTDIKIDNFGLIK